MTPDQTSRDPEQIRLDVGRKVRAVQVSDQFTAILACLERFDLPDYVAVEIVGLVAPVLRSDGG